MCLPVSAPGGDVSPTVRNSALAQALRGSHQTEEFTSVSWDSLAQEWVFTSDEG